MGGFGSFALKTVSLDNSIPNTSENVKENAPSPLTLAEDLKRAEQYLETVYKSADTKVDSETSNNVKYSKIDNPVLLRASEDGYMEVMSGTYEEVKTEYDRLVQEQTYMVDEAFEGVESGKATDNRYSSAREFGRGNADNGAKAQSKGLQNNSGRNRTDMLRSDKRLSQSTSGQKNNTELTKATSNEAAFCRCLYVFWRR